MDWQQIFELIDPSFILVVAACWVIGFTLKRTPRIPDWTIVYIVTVVAIIFASLLEGFSVSSVLQGVLCGAFAVYGNQLLKQTTEGFSKQSDSQEG